MQATGRFLVENEAGLAGLARGTASAYHHVMFTFTFYPRSPRTPRIESRTTLVENIEKALDEAISMAAHILPDCKLIEIEGRGVQQLWIRRDGQWERDDSAQRP